MDGDAGHMVIPGPLVYTLSAEAGSVHPGGIGLKCFLELGFKDICVPWGATSLSRPRLRIVNGEPTSRSAPNPGEHNASSS